MTNAKRKLAAILAADAVGYSRLMADDEQATIETLNAHREVFRHHVEAHDGRVVDTAGDSVLAVFDSVVEAVHSGIEIQKDLQKHNTKMPEVRRMMFRIGVNLGDVFVQDDGTIYGNGVNVAARLEGLAEPGGLWISDSAHSEVEGKIAENFIATGEHQVKNISRAIATFGWHPVGSENKVMNLSKEEGQKPTVAVGNFDGTGRSEDIEVLAEGVREAVSVSMSNQTGWVVLNETNQAQFVINARIQGLGSRYRTTVQLLDQESGEHIQSDRFDGEISDLFESQDNLAHRIYMSTRLGIDRTVAKREADKAGQRPITEQNTESLLSQAGFAMWGNNRAEWNRAHEMLETVLARDPDNFMALAIIAFCHLFEATNGYTGVNDTDRSAASEKAKRATRLNEQSDFAHFVLSYVHLVCEHNFELAKSEAKRSLELNPYYNNPMGQLGLVLNYEGHAEEGITLCKKSIDADPRSPGNPRWMQHLSLGHFVLEQYDLSAKWAERSDQQAPDSPRTLLLQTSAMGNMGQLVEANVAAEKIRALCPDFTISKIERWPFKDESVWEQLIAGLKKAELPA